MFSTIFILCLGLLAATRPSESQKRGGPRVVTDPQDIEVEAGSSVLLPCSIKNVGRRSVFWFKGDAPEGRELLMQMKSVRGHFEVPREYQEIIDTGKLGTDGSSLILNNVVAADSASYTCSIAWARQSVTHQLKVIGGDIPGIVTTIPSHGQVNVGEGLPASLSCVASWNPPATISWFREGDPEVLTVGNVLNFYSSKREDSGRYYCRTENGVAAAVNSYFDLTVQYVEIKADVGDVVASGEDQMAQLSCTVTGSPRPQVAWYTSAGPITQDNRHRMTSQGDTHYLQLLQMTSADLGVYQCYGYNEKSRAHASIKVMSSPGTVTVLGVAHFQGQKYTVTWEVNSLAPIRFYHVALRERNSDSVESFSIPGSSNPSDGRSLFRVSGEFDMQPGSTYEIMIKAVGEAYQPGPDQDEPFVFTVPYEEGAPVTVDSRPPVYSRPPPPPPAPREYESRSDNQGQTYGDRREDGGREQPHGEEGQYYGRQGQSYGSQGQSYGSQGQSYGSQGQSYGNQGQSYGSQGQSYGSQGQSYGNQGQSHGSQGQSYGNQGQSYGSQELNYGSQGSSYGVRGSTYDAPDDDYTDETQTEVNDQDAWNWWKVTMTLMSRLPQVARIMQ